MRFFFYLTKQQHKCGVSPFIIYVRAIWNLMIAVCGNGLGKVLYAYRDMHGLGQVGLS